MASTLNRLSDSSATCLMCSGRLLRELHLPPSLGLASHPNFVAITTFPRNGASASPTSSSFRSGPYTSAERDTSLHRGVEKRNHLLLVSWRSVGPTHSHAAEPNGRYFQIAVSKLAFLHG